jgi:hypothetical protein
VQRKDAPFILEKYNNGQSSELPEELIPKSKDQFADLIPNELRAQLSNQKFDVDIEAKEVACASTGNAVERSNDVGVG